MKEKIFAQLKLACGEKTSVSDRTLDKLATTLSLGVTDETTIPALIEAQKPFLQELDGNISFIAAKAVKEHVPAATTTAAATTTTAAATTTTDTEPSWFSEWKKKQEEEVSGIKSQLETKSKAEASAALVTKAKEGFLSKFKVSDAEKSLFEKAVQVELLTNPTHADAESMITGFKAQYEGLRSVIGLPGLEAQVPAGKDGKTTTPIIEKMITDLQNAGKLPKEQS